MASWLRAAEELFEVVDRTAKQVVRDRAADESELSPSAASEHGQLQRKSNGALLEKNASAKSPVRSMPLLPSKSSAQTKESGDILVPTELKRSNSSSKADRRTEFGNKDESASAATNYAVSQSTIPSKLEDLGDVDTFKHSKSSAEVKGSEMDSVSQEPEHIETENVSLETRPEEVTVSESSMGPESLSNQRETDRKTQIRAHPDSSSQNRQGNDACSAQNASKGEIVEHVLRQTGEDRLVRCKLAAETDAVSVDLFVDRTSPKEVAETVEKSFPTKVIESSTNPMVALHKGAVPDDELKAEDQIVEARSLLQNAASSGKSKEARLAKVCAGLSSRLQEYKAENAQLEELLENERKLKDSLEVKINQLLQELAAEQASTNAIQIEMAAALSSKNSEIERLLSLGEKYKKQAELASQEVISLQADMEAIGKNRDMTETRMIQALREELASGEQRAEEERAAHSATRTAAVERETQLEHQVAEAISALMRMQGMVDEKTQKATDLEHKLSVLEVECATLNQQIQEKEVRAWRDQKRQSEEILQNAWREESERARKVQRDSEAKIVTLEAECQKLRVELTSVKRDCNQSSMKANAEMERHLNELTELLYLKQTQLEAMASEKAAALLQLEKESKLFREAKAEAERNRLRGHVLGYDHDNDLRSFDSLGLQQRRIVSPSIQTAAKFLDSGVVSVGRFLWRRPLARIFLLFYLVFVHLFLMYLLHRLQEQADRTISSKEELEAAVAAGLLQHAF
ncbi:hypothetical protein O6H91_10G031300 [Diphasiastrum complanatum]|uniref:Uncharacterized protein n=1 Tax=Diphasiastrum complanatum TaxID=34168 RepID=A0ACC2CFN3_DIPCM|nr:hypothetical protein O6H91_Y287100 [Diphasiastrum complanatum]KAJ7540798.1 hypothetical protein O6H91_10G031300 [Diphasiastrum complanatum]